MRTILRGLGLMLMLVTVLAGTIGSASAAHNGNNKANLAGVGTETDATGTAIVNYREGTSTFNGTVTVRNLIPGETYEFYVTGAAAGTAGVLICSGEASESGLFRCSAQGLALPGFASAEVREDDGDVVATGTFARRGNCRDPQQAGSQCEANHTRGNVGD